MIVLKKLKSWLDEIEIWGKIEIVHIIVIFEPLVIVRKVLEIDDIFWHKTFRESHQIYGLNMLNNYFARLTKDRNEWLWQLKMTRKKLELPNPLRRCGTTGHEYVLAPTTGGSNKITRVWNLIGCEIQRGKKDSWTPSTKM